MKKLRAIAAALLVLGCCAAAGACRTARLPEGLAELHARYHATAELPEGEAAYRALEDHARGLVALESGGRRFASHDVYIARELTGEHGWRCQPDIRGHADDTIHTTEFPPYATVVVAPELEARLTGPAGLERLAIGDPAAMHATGYAEVLPVERTEKGVLRWPEAPVGEKLLVALLRHESGLFVKYVWVVRLASH